MRTYEEYGKEYLKTNTIEHAMLVSAREQVELLFEIRDLLEGMKVLPLVNERRPGGAGGAG